LFDDFHDKQDLFEEIKNTYNGNKKVIDVLTSINNLLNPNINTYSNTKNVVKTTNVNLLGGDEENNSGVQNNNKQVNLLVSFLLNLK
jgi:hypothetical protein